MSDVSNTLDNIGKVADTAEKSMSFIEKILNKLPWYRANALFIEDVEKSDLPTAKKMALLYNHKALKKQIKNQASIYDMSNAILIEKGKTLEIEADSLDEDWFAYFNDIVKNVSDEEMQTIWAKILAGECEKHGSVGKKLLSILQVISKDEAAAFAYMCSHLIIFKFDDNNEDIFDNFFIWPERNLCSGEKLYDYYNGSIIDDFAIMNLKGLGLIDYNNTGFLVRNSKITINNFEKEFIVQTNNPDGVPSGLIAFTSPGMELVEILKNDIEFDRSSTYADLIKEYYIEKRCEVIISEKKN